ncbi:hypothetical protein [Aquimarina brevivitae]|uniref:Uncharacterized protein n=1 Tax=Aquimarina brevivitae TaxID=323412 RepID=A0A4Q7PI95_9FLAO|nr:hypothetical protein [Aquimarina brevivitae]RZT00156.1 hypothetical protein EV197_1389 [Aquimarina brevivitae]
MKNKSVFYFLILTISVFAFVVKGLVYASLGSFIPLILATGVFALFVIFRTKPKVLSRILFWWAIGMILWSLIRFLIGGINNFVKPLTENHLHEQLGIQGTIISLLFFVIGILLLRKKNRWHALSFYYEKLQSS